MASNQRGSYGDEIKASISKPDKRPSQVKKESKADQARDVKAGIKEGSPQDEKLDAMPANQASAVMPTGQPNSGGVAGAPPAHVAMAASIAHAILGNRS